MSIFRLMVDFADLDDKEIEVPEDTTAANLSIFVDDECLTLNRPRRPRFSPLSESVFGPLSGLADWLIENWGAVLWETPTAFPKNRFGGDAPERIKIPGVKEAANNWDGYVYDPSELPEYASWQHRHLLGHACSDLAIPSIVIIPEDRDIIIAADRLPASHGASVQFLSSGGVERAPSVFVVQKAAFEAEARQFVDNTLARVQSLARFNHWATWLQDRWRHSQIEEKNTAKRLSWMLGRISAARVEELGTSQPRLGEGLSQILLDCPVVTSRRDLVPVEDMISATLIRSSSTSKSDASHAWQTIVSEPIPTNQADYAQGYQLARLVRDRMNLGKRPIGDLSRILDRLGIGLEEGVDTLMFRVAACATGGGRAHIISAADDSDRNVARLRFGITSTLGRLLWQSHIPEGKPLCVAQGVHSMISQSRRANAFAAEFLLPGAAIEGPITETNQVYQLSEKYGISATAARWHVRNVRESQYLIDDNE